MHMWVCIHMLLGRKNVWLPSYQSWLPKRVKLVKPIGTNQYKSVI